MKEMSDIGLERSEKKCGQSVGRTAVTVALFFAFAALFNGEALLRDVELMPYGTKRDVCIAVFKPMAWLSRVTHFSVLRAQIEKTISAAP